uniref:Zinc metalloproteinase n=1 Tax=Caenorhabditis tropicalis TaxID=1561998 RepID=A0A1I7U1M1_9PELO
MPRFVVYFIGFSAIFYVFLANKTNNVNQKNKWTFENGQEKTDDSVSVTIPVEGPFSWKWTWNSKVNSTTTTTTTSAPTTTKPPVYKLKPAARKSLRNALRGTTPEKRKKQLAQMGKKIKVKKISKTESTKLHNSYRRVKETEDPPALDMFEINERAGLNDYLFQGDMNLDDSQITEMSSAASSTRKKRQIRNSAKFWTDKTVIYYFDSGTTSTMQQVATDAMQFLTDHTCVKFSLNSTATNRVKIINGVGCYSNVGMLGGEQTLSLGSGCEMMGTAAHELAHTLGVFHTQMRSDRDDYVTIDLTDVPVDSQSNFYKLTAAESTNLVDYEYGSFLHYSGKAFVSSGGVDSIVPKEPVMVYTMGGRIVSFLDLKMLNLHYSCSCPASLPCENGGYANPAKCTECICPYGFGGTLCNQRPDYGCGSDLEATNTWQQSNYTFGNSSNSATARPYFLYCVHWIKAPTGKQIQFRIDSAYNSQCTYGCVFNGVEPRLKTDMTTTQARYCCKEFNGEVMLSDVNPLPIFSYNRYYITTFSWSYRYVDPVNNCVDIADITTCLALKTAKEEGCNLYDDAQLKVMCAVTFDLCGKTVGASCADRFPASQCSTYSTNGLCTSELPLIAEFSCASTCGFCSAPV